MYQLTVDVSNGIINRDAFLAYKDDDGEVNFYHL
jgi:hypothetical protein